MGLFSFLGVHSPVQIGFFTFFRGGGLVGTDGSGNRYYRAKARKGYNHDRRWVIYKGAMDASRVPAEWHGWLHHQTDVVPVNNAGFRREWQAPHQSNMTGTNKAYRPPGHVLAQGVRDKATGDYEAWTPNE